MANRHTNNTKVEKKTQSKIRKREKYNRPNVDIDV